MQVMPEHNALANNRDVMEATLRTADRACFTCGMIVMAALATGGTRQSRESVAPQWNVPQNRSYHSHLSPRPESWMRDRMLRRKLV